MKRVELHTAQRTKKEHEHGYCVRDGLKAVTVDSLGGYKRLAATARRLSKHIGDVEVGLQRYKETETLEEGMAAVYIQTLYTNKNVLEYETFDFFEGGRYVKTVKYSYSTNGVIKTEYVNQ